MRLSEHAAVGSSVRARPEARPSSKVAPRSGRRTASSVGVVADPAGLGSPCSALRLPQMARLEGLGVGRPAAGLGGQGHVKAGQRLGALGRSVGTLAVACQAGLVSRPVVAGEVRPLRSCEGRRAPRVVGGGVRLKAAVPLLRDAVQGAVSIAPAALPSSAAALVGVARPLPRRRCVPTGRRPVRTPTSAVAALLRSVRPSSGAAESFSSEVRRTRGSVLPGPAICAVAGASGVYGA